VKRRREEKAQGRYEVRWRGEERETEERERERGEGRERKGRARARERRTRGPCGHACTHVWACMHTRTHTHVSGPDEVSTPQLFYTHFYNHAHRLRLEKLSHVELSRSSNGFFKPLLDPGNGFGSETAVARAFRKWNGQNFNGHVCNGHSPTDASVRSGVAAM
jgi:hypothetical protein